jgi:hypothetical protein
LLRCWQRFLKKLDAEWADVYVRPMRSKWASCLTNGILSFNAEQLDLDLHVGNCVIVHELLYFDAPNHGKLWKGPMRAHVRLGALRGTLRKRSSRQDASHAPASSSGSGKAIWAGICGVIDCIAIQLFG